MLLRLSPGARPIRRLAEPLPPYCPEPFRVPSLIAACPSSCACASVSAAFGYRLV